MTLIEHDHMVEQLSAALFDESLCNSNLPWASNRNSNRVNTQALRGLQNFAVKRMLAIKNEKLRRRIVRKSLPELLRYPRTGWISNDVAVKNTSAVMKDDEEIMQHAQSERWLGEEIQGGDGSTVIVQRSRPSSPEQRS